MGGGLWEEGAPGFLAPRPRHCTDLGTCPPSLQPHSYSEAVLESCWPQGRGQQSSLRAACAGAPSSHPCTHARLANISKRLLLPSGGRPRSRRWQMGNHFLHWHEHQMVSPSAS